MKDVVISIYDDLDNPHYAGGGATVVHEIAKQLSREYRVTVISSSRWGNRRVVRSGVHYVLLPVGWAGPRLGQLLFTIVLTLSAVRQRPSIWIESLTPPFSASLLPVATRSTVVGLVQMLSGADMTRRYGLPFATIERLGLRLYDHFVVLNEADRAAVETCNARATCRVIPNGVTRPDVSETEFGSGDYILFLGRIDVEQKGLDLLAQAVAGSRPALPVVVAGSGTAKEERKLRSRAEVRSGHLRLLGRVVGDEKTRLLRSAALVVVPSRYETFSLVALEAMAFGKPVVCFDLDRLAWIPDSCCLRVKAFDVDELGAALAALSLDDVRRRTMGRNGHRVSRAYSWGSVGERYRAMVEELPAREGTKEHGP